MMIPNAKDVVLAIPDTQLPFSHEDACSFLKLVAERFQPTQVIQLGDFFDLHALSQYPHDPDGMSAGRELREAVKKAQEYYELFPNAKVLTSNHDIRMYKRAYNAGIPAGFLKEYHEWMQFPPGWSIHEKVEIDNVLYIHGEGVSGHKASLQLALYHMQSVVHGHLHTFANISYRATTKALIFGCNAGCLIDLHAYAFAYNKHDINRPILGCAVIQRGIPILIPMLLGEDGRWVGKLVGF